MLSRFKVPPGTLLAFVIMFAIATASATAASSVINGKKIKKGSIPYSALSKDAKKQLAKSAKPGPQGPAGPAGQGVTTYWAMIGQNGSVIRSSGGVTSTWGDNGGSNPQYRVTFPSDISQCGYFGATSDPDAFNQGTSVQPTDVGIGRATIDNRTLAVTVTYGSTGDFGGTGLSNSVFFNDNFFIAVVC